MPKVKRKPLTYDDILAQCNSIRNRKQEYLVCLSIDGANRLIAKRTVTIGLLDRVLVHPREVFAAPVRDRAACVIVAHNHPSGDVEPSGHDIEMTNQLVAAGQLIGIPLRDHIIVAREEHYSFRRGALL